MYCMHFAKLEIGQNNPPSTYSSLKHDEHLCCITYILPYSTDVSLSAILFQLINNWIYLVSYVGNRGTIKSIEIKRVIRDRALLSQVAFFVVTILGAFVHEFFYCILVCISRS